MDFSAPRKSRLSAPQLQAQLSRLTDRTRLRRLKNTLCHMHVTHPAPPPMLHARRPAQTRARQQQQEYLRCARCGPDPAAFKGATVHGLVLHMVQKHGGPQVFPESVAQLRNLDRAACVARDTIRSRRCHRCSHCKRDTPLPDLIVRRQPGHQEAALEGSPTVHQPFHSSQPVPPSDTLDDSPLPNCPFATSFSQNETSSYSPIFVGRHLPLCHSLGGKPLGSRQWPPVLSHAVPMSLSPAVGRGAERIRQKSGTETTTSAVGGW